MVALPSYNLTLADWTKRRDPDGKAAVIANILSQTNQILDDAVFKQANGPTGHTCTVATGLPAVYWRQFNQGIYPSAGSTAQVTEGIGMLQTRSEVDVKLASLEDDVAAFRLGELRLRLEGVNQEMAKTLIYANSSATPEKFMGIAPRYSLTTAGNGQNVLSCNDGTPTANQQTSIYLVGWGDETIFCTFPKGSSAGIVQQDLGEESVDVFNAAGAYTGKMQAYVDLVSWDMGLVVKDWRYGVRICNIDVPDLKALSGSQALTAYNTNILHQMLNAHSRVPNLGMVRPAFYVNRFVFSALGRMAMEKSSPALSLESAMDQFGTARRYLAFQGTPIRLCDAILNTEAVVA